MCKCPEEVGKGRGYGIFAETQAVFSLQNPRKYANMGKWVGSFFPAGGTGRDIGKGIGQHGEENSVF